MTAAPIYVLACLTLLYGCCGAPPKQPVERPDPPPWASINAWNHTDFPLAWTEPPDWGTSRKPYLFEARPITPPWYEVAQLGAMFPDAVISGWELQVMEPCEAHIELDDGVCAWRVMDATISLVPGVPRRIFFVLKLNETSSPLTVEATLYDAVGAGLVSLMSRKASIGFAGSRVVTPAAPGWRMGYWAFARGHGRASPLLTTSWGPFGTVTRAEMILFGWNYTGSRFEDAKEYWEKDIRTWEFPVMILTVRTLPPLPPS